ncbi:hypothetical protein OG756_41735 (plasmid) [Streptomyces sp. NBC_01310]|uniref:hypothetical protein n=1 Tax=Streptomyces TaxID=1883 RepID=UPI0022559FF5|nr:MULTISPECIES: hypothetical protein [Streptomyces]MCX5278004.1 hypothetical protein [Streptomyces virginiae]WSJ64542.1 hypothetical protein OG756_41735 [Streptomyces sp. NBC_01310]
MPVLRQITTCREPATFVVERRSGRRGRPLEYQLGTCARHRWLADGWAGRRTVTREPDGRCGTVLDYRSFDAVVRSHVEEWIRPLTAEGPEDHGGDVAAALRAAHDRLWGAAVVSRTRPQEDGVRAALDQAARAAEAARAGALDEEASRAQVLMALSVAETLDALGRGA